MRHAFGKPVGMIARVYHDQILMSVRTKDKNKAHAIEAFRRSKMKFPGRQRIIISDKWGFTKFTREQYAEMMEDGRLVVDGNGVKYRPRRGKLPF
jgi:large subunit ribosomal protein L10e